MDLILDRLYGHRQWPSGLAAAGVLALAVVVATQPITPPRKPDIKSPVAVTLTALPDTPEPPRPEPPAPTPPPRPPEPQPPKPPQPPQPATPPAATPPVSTPPTATAPVEAASSAPTAVSAPPAPPSPPAPAVEAPPPAAPASSRTNTEADYTTGLRGYLNSIKRYPTGRDAAVQRPSGTARVWFVLDRTGQLVNADIDTSSDSMLLDRAALATVRKGRYQPFPADAWPGETQHRFTVDIDFVAGG